MVPIRILARLSVVQPLVRGFLGVRHMSTTQKPPKSAAKILGFGVAAGVIAGTGYAVNDIFSARKSGSITNTDDGYLLKELPPNISPSRRVIGANDTSGLKLTLYQYQTCPFCCKVRAFLDYNGISYNVVEVNPVLRQQIKWSSYRKVPMLVVEDASSHYLKIVDSATIISVLTSYFYDKKRNLEEIIKFYPSVNFSDESGGNKAEIMNKYFIMFGKEPRDRKKEDITEERRWRRWADNVLVHTLSPNVYRTPKEALQAFHWFSEAGNWDKHFAAWERFIVVYVGATAMWIVGKRLKTRHGLKDDVRRSFYDACNQWVREVDQKKAQFHGGKSPDLADLAVYGVLNSIEGCDAFQDALEHTAIGDWYNRMQSTVHKNRGTVLL